MMFRKSSRKEKSWDLSWTRLNASWSPTVGGFNVQSSTLRWFQRVEVEESVLFGTPLFVGPALDSAWSQPSEHLRRAVYRMSNISSQEAMILLRASFSAPRVLHLLQCSPSKDHPALEMFDSQLRSAVCHITNSRLSDSQWLQASLPVKQGGFGVRRVASLALSAFLASAASTLSIQALILTGCSGSIRDYHTGIFVGLVGPVWHTAWSTSSQTDILGSPCRRMIWPRPSSVLPW